MYAKSMKFPLIDGVVEHFASFHYDAQISASRSKFYYNICCWFGMKVYVNKN